MKKIKDFLIEGGSRARPIPNLEIINFIDSALKSEYLYDEKILPTFIEEYYQWIQSSKLNCLKNLDKFNKIDFVHGTSQAFDFFYMKHHKRRFRCLLGDFVYHKVSWKNNFNWKYIEEDKLRKNDAFIISFPFSDCGCEHPDMGSLLDECEMLNIPVFIDAAYHCVGRDINFDLDRPCIESIAFSMSKAFCGMERLRVGIRCRRVKEDDGAVLLNNFHMVNKIGVGVGLELCRNFDYDYNQNKFRNKQIKLCKRLKIEPSDCVIFGLADKTHPEFGNYNRGSQWRRVCLSYLLEHDNIDISSFPEKTKSLFSIKKDSKDWHYNPAILSIDSEYVGKIMNLNCSKLLSNLEWGDMRYHITVEDNDANRIASLDRLKMDFKKWGYTNYNTQFQRIYDEDVSGLFLKIKELCNLDFCNVNITKQSPGQILPFHFDTYKRILDMYGLKDSDRSRLKRYLIFLEDWNWGHFIQVGNNVLSNWKAGDIYTYKYGMYHLSCNVGLEPKYTMQITGMPNDKSLHNTGQFEFHLDKD